jgi:hypothetical protein
VRRLAAVLASLALAWAWALGGAGSAGGATPSARVGAFYFDAWSGPFSEIYWTGLRGGPFEERRPLYGWSTRPRSTMRTQLGWAHRAGIGFFLFEWFNNASGSSSPYLNNGLDHYRRLRDRRGVEFALAYVNADGGPGANYVVPRDRWRAVARRWVSYFKDPDYVRVRGKPLLTILDISSFTAQWGDTAGVNEALAVVRREARAQGLPGVFIVGGFNVVDYRYDWSVFPAEIEGQDYDAITQFAYPAALRPRDGSRPYPQLVAAAKANWGRFLRKSPVPYVPGLMVGWDARPWRSRTIFGFPTEHDRHWFRRSPAEVGAFVGDAAAWVRRHRAMRVTRRPLVFLTSWNELGEGHYIVPTVGERFGYLTALARALGLGWR